MVGRGCKACLGVPIGCCARNPPEQSSCEILQEIGEKCGEHLARFFADFRPSISREDGCNKIHEKSSTFSSFFTAATLGAREPNKLCGPKVIIVGLAP